jgi:hypothetical protein
MNIEGIDNTSEGASDMSEESDDEEETYNTDFGIESFDSSLDDVDID